MPCAVTTTPSHRNRLRGLESALDPVPWQTAQRDGDARRRRVPHPSGRLQRRSPHPLDIKPSALFCSSPARRCIRSRGPIAALHAKKPKRLPAVLAKEDVRRVLDHLSGAHRLMAQRRYGSGLRLIERLRLRVKDLDFAQRAIMVRDGTGMDDRVTTAPNSLVAPLQERLQRVKRRREEDPGQRLWRRFPPLCPEAQVPACQPGAGLARCLSLRPAVGGPAERRCAPPSPRRAWAAKGHLSGGPTGRHPQAGHSSYVSSLLRSPLAGGRLRHPLLRIACWRRASGLAKS